MFTPLAPVSQDGLHSCNGCCERGVRLGCCLRCHNLARRLPWAPKRRHARLPKQHGAVYRHDAQAKALGLSPEARLRFHQEHSQKIMDELHQWMSHQLEEKLVEPNSGLGDAFDYMLKRWETLTLFLRKAGAPLDNNICEQALKMAILHRKNSLGYKTQNGARLGDMFMSLIHTCRLCAANPLDYLNTLQRHAKEALEHPTRWLPWNYKQALPNSDTS